MREQDANTHGWISPGDCGGEAVMLLRRGCCSVCSTSLSRFPLQSFQCCCLLSPRGSVAVGLRAVYTPGHPGDNGQ